MAVFATATVTLALYAAWRLPAGELAFVAYAYVGFSGLTVVLVVVPITILAALLRWAWTRTAPPDWRHATWAAVTLGAVAAPLGLLAWLVALEGAAVLHQPAWWSVLAPPLLLCGGVAGYLAHRWISPFSRRYWALVSVTAVVASSSWLVMEVVTGSVLL